MVFKRGQEHSGPRSRSHLPVARRVAAVQRKTVPSRRRHPATPHGKGSGAGTPFLAILLARPLLPGIGPRGSREDRMATPHHGRSLRVLLPSRLPRPEETHSPRAGIHSSFGPK